MLFEHGMSELFADSKNEEKKFNQVFPESKYEKKRFYENGW